MLVVKQTGRRFVSIISNMCRVRSHRACTSGWLGVCALEKGPRASKGAQNDHGIVPKAGDACMVSEAA